jgi:hypothetical protein
LEDDDFCAGGKGVFAIGDLPREEIGGVKEGEAGAHDAIVRWVLVEIGDWI